MDPTYRSLILQRRKKHNRLGFIPAILAALGGVKLISNLGKQYFGRNSAMRRKGAYINQYGKVIPNKIMQQRSYMRTLIPARKGHYDRRKGKMAKLVPAMHSKQRLIGAVRNMGIKKARAKHIIKKITKMRALKNKRRKRSRRSRRKGDLDNDFLSEFGNIDVEPTRTKSWTRLAWDAVKKTLSKKEARDIGKSVGKNLFNIGTKKAEDMLNKMTEKQTEKVAKDLLINEIKNNPKDIWFRQAQLLK
ncbi:TPA_asm: hypothetical protein [Anelosimus tangle-web spider MELD virus]|nr:TPA_asm: hypothetical protein [Anelosimus tangle-web spider MELD virus]